MAEGKQTRANPQSLAVVLDCSSMVPGVRSALDRSFDYQVLSDWLRGIGRVQLQVAYGTASGHKDMPVVSRTLERLGVDRRTVTPDPSKGKDSASRVLAEDVLGIARASKEVGVFCIASMDPGIVPLLRKLRNRDKRVVLVGVDALTSAALRRECDEHVSYESLCGPGLGGKRAVRKKRVLRQHGQRSPVEAPAGGVQETPREVRRQAVAVSVPADSRKPRKTARGPAVEHTGVQSGGKRPQALTRAGVVRTDPPRVLRESPVEPEPRQPSGKELTPLARQLLGDLVERNRSALREGISGARLRLAISLESGFDELRLGVDSPEHLLEGATIENLLRSRRNPDGTRTYFLAGKRPGGKAAGRPAGPVARRTSPAATGPPRSAAPSLPGPDSGLPSAMDESIEIMLPVPSQQLDSAVRAACAVLRRDRRLFRSGLLLAEIRSLLATTNPPFDMTIYGLRSVHALVSHACERGYLRKTAGSRPRFTGTRALATLPKGDGGVDRRAPDSVQGRRRRLRR